MATTWDQTTYQGGSTQTLAPPPASTPTQPLPPTAGYSGSTAQNDAFAYVSSLLGQYGLPSLGDWAWQQIVDGHGADQVIQSLRQQPAYAERFKGMAIRQANGLPAVSEGEYIAYERQAGQLMRAAGMPVGFYDSPDDYANLIGKDVSVNELNQRITGAYTRVAQAPVEVRDAFANFFGPTGDTAFAAYFLDADRAAPMLEKAVTEAEIAGTGARFGIGISADVASRLADVGVNLNTASQGFQTLAAQSALFRESVTEAKDLEMGVEGVNAAFGVNATDAEAVARRKEERAAAVGGSTNQAGVSAQGIVGLGSARGA
jgi:hypothetical protein